MFRVVLSLALAAFLGSYAFAGKHEGKQAKSPEELFKSLDVNNDGVVTFGEFSALTSKIKKAEARDKKEQAFKALDKDGKGLTLEQFKTLKLHKGHHKKQQDDAAK